MIQSYAWFSALLFLVSMSLALSAQRDAPAERAPSYCPPVSSDEVVAATSEQGALLETAECTERFRRFVDETVGTLRESYDPIFESLGADPKTIGDLSRLMAREQLLSTGWISHSSLVHHQSELDARVLRETRDLLRSLLSKEDFTALQDYKKSIPTRELIKPVISRLESAGIPLSREKIESAVADVAAWFVGLMNRVGEGQSDEPLDCKQADAFVGRREAELLSILSRSLDERQASVAHGYYRERAEQREKETATKLSRAGDGPCTIREF